MLFLVPSRTYETSLLVDESISDELPYSGELDTRTLPFSPIDLSLSPSLPTQLADDDSLATKSEGRDFHAFDLLA